jgi:hypothetical protein
MNIAGVCRRGGARTASVRLEAMRGELRGVDGQHTHVCPCGKLGVRTAVKTVVLSCEPATVVV